MPEKNIYLCHSVMVMKSNFILFKTNSLYILLYVYANKYAKNTRFQYKQFFYKCLDLSIQSKLH